ncbi:MAG: hypothetical protein HeimC3_18760 [Candidatus Heimdallarchaeota archaeon LC_3]|nr:MAG: hypothetical protein HeimC3_18760 [Candidatus Heimdallarchaeota archaeon LC_3]
MFILEEDGAKFRVLTVFVLIGFIMTLGLVFLTVMFPESSGQYHEFINPENIKTELITDSEQARISLYSIIIDNFFILGYFALFYGAYLLTKHLDPVLPRVGFIMGISTAVFDILENAVLLGLLNGVPVGYEPVNLMFGIQWLFMSIKDISSVIATLIFAVLLIISLNKTDKNKGAILLLAVFLLLYTILGSIGLMDPLFLQLRNISFVLDMAVASAVFYAISRS